MGHSEVTFFAGRLVHRMLLTKSVTSSAPPRAGESIDSPRTGVSHSAWYPVSLEGFTGSFLKSFFVNKKKTNLFSLSLLSLL